MLQMICCCTILLILELLISTVNSLATKIWYRNDTLGIAYLYHENCIHWTQSNAENLCINTYNSTSVVSVPTFQHWIFLNSIIDVRPTGDCADWANLRWIGVGADSIGWPVCTASMKKNLYKWWSGDTYDANAFTWASSAPTEDCPGGQGLHFSFENREMEDTNFNDPDKYAVLCQKVLTQNPTVNPTTNPNIYPSENPTFIPTSNPTLNPSQIPTVHPSVIPTVNPTINPTLLPSKIPTTIPTKTPSMRPTIDQMVSYNLSSTLGKINIPIDSTEQNDQLQKILYICIACFSLILICLVMVIGYVLYKKKKKEKLNTEIIDLVDTAKITNDKDQYAHNVVKTELCDNEDEEHEDMYSNIHVTCTTKTPMDVLTSTDQNVKETNEEGKVDNHDEMCIEMGHKSADNITTQGTIYSSSTEITSGQV